jgi:RNA polymerase sigma-70 factor (ECF subfamily)
MTLEERRRRLVGALRPRVGAAAEDLAQEALLRAQARGIPDVGLGWLVRTAMNAFLDERRHLRVEAAAAPALAIAIADDGARPCRCVEQVLGRLPAREQEVIVRAELEGEAPDRLAEALGVTRGNLAVRRHRARRSLERQLRDRCGACADEGCLHCDCV